ncbi:uncharacterized protein PHACADRAFT_257317 [Phanerochaete carnosa HHB-10118-sp]|uniref:Uncharacterized protein n=1 Tax=Phanerochaete carnosa (strain HHB-10118-sp) TaxID=650164 RepID=K5WB48_PHACS|nr:uncharacterized protein PHACADRAFT_257317 [Phanerochaete carnosa HHB-10118-sp]EKM56214.1 hypothetical protein PHACADRAFT_257317 [Phanerochaete carnosa HHB-10118-sp]
MITDTYPPLFQPNSTVSPTAASWHADPAVRGTWGIISTCLATLVICAWNAVHIDIPIRSRSWELSTSCPGSSSGCLRLTSCYTSHAANCTVQGRFLLLNPSV